MNQEPVNVAGMHFHEVETVEVQEWHPLPDGQGRPEQVHLLMKSAGWEHPFIMRFKSGRPVDELIVSLIHHRDRVWPDEDRPVMKRPGSDDSQDDPVPA